MTRVAVVTSGFPRRSETFAVNELLALEAAGMLEAVFATKPGDGREPQPGCERLLPLVTALPDAPDDELGAIVARTLAGRSVTGVHGYFAHTPAAVAVAAAERLGVPYGFSVHARDARKVTPAELGRRSRDAAVVIACNEDVACDVRQAGAAAEVLPHGVDLDRFRATSARRGKRLELLAVGRLVEKKGFDVLIAAAAELTCAYRLRILGEGPERERLERLVAAAGLHEHVELPGGISHTDLPRALAAADVFVVPSVVDRTGDRDGLPNVVLEAMACGRAIVASDVGAVSSAIVDGLTGLLVPPSEPDALRRALERLALQPSLGARLGRAARARAERSYDLAACTDRLLARLDVAYA